jgi:tetratricopeptide (TPR) repeat protein
MGDKRAIAGSMMNVGFAEHRDENYAKAHLLFLESLRLSRELGEAWYATHALYALGKTLVAMGQWQEAYGYTKESLEMVYKYDFLWGIPYLIAVFGHIAFKREQWQYAVELYGVVQSMCDIAGTALMPECGGEYHAYVERVRQVLDESTFEIAWNRGYTMSPEVGIQYALQVADPLPEKIGS